MRIKTALIVLAVEFCGESAIAMSGITPIGPFVGDFSEGFESFTEIPGPAANRAGPIEILSGHALLSGIHPNFDVNPLYIWDSGSGFSLDDLTALEGNVSAIPFDGTQGLHLQTVLNKHPIALIDFHTPAIRFGGYWVHAVTRTMRDPIILNFFDEAGTLIDTVEFRYDYAKLHGVSQWFGWSSPFPIRSITFQGPWAGIDGIQINVIPEPTSKVVTLIAFLASNALFCRALPVRRARESASREFHGAACTTNPVELRATE